ncbi:hypothetical protein SAMN05444339_10251 [Loktanella atrilutea]|uniref:Uncharacterized protein n=1 Tax=Loktanella atrilutea TaxID=366533 RepID=A0A1M4WAW5_LOKAT|nr:hypothetical protein [Loktanella atrilutea]SHE78359.1 hypothetical protein SAMN05444339_10251 [Loktanella atrilutea]
MTGRILALDLATTTGWALGVPGQPITSGSIRFSGSTEDQSIGFARYTSWIGELLSTHDVTEVCYEQPMDPRHMVNKVTGRATTNFATIRLLLGMCAITEAQARIYRVPRLTEAPVQSVRKHLLKHRPAKGQSKIAVAQMLKILGYRPVDDNEADALALILYVSAIRAPGADIATPLPLRSAQNG